MTISLTVSIIAGAAAILATAFGHLFFKFFALNKNPIYLGLVILCLGSAPISSFIALKNLSIDQLYLCTAFVPILTAIFGYVIFKEQVGRHHLIGLALTVSGASLYFLAG